jgi:hypothetical protein
VVAKSNLNQWRLLQNLRCETSRTYRNKKMESLKIIIKTKILEIFTEA